MTISEPNSCIAELIASWAAYRRNGKFLKPMKSEEKVILIFQKPVPVALLRNNLTFLKYQKVLN